MDLKQVFANSRKRVTDGVLQRSQDRSIDALSRSSQRLEIPDVFSDAGINTVIDGDTIQGGRLIGIDTAESSADVDSNEKAKKLQSQYGLSLTDQKSIGLAGKRKLEEYLTANPNTKYTEMGMDVYGRKLLYNPDLTNYMLGTGLVAPTAYPTAKEESVYNAAQQKLRRLDPKTADFMEGTRLYNTQHIKTSIGEDVANIAKAGASGVLGVAESVLEAPTKLYNALGGYYLEEGTSVQKSMPTYTKAVKGIMDTMQEAADIIKRADKEYIGYNPDKQDRLKYAVGRAFDEGNYVTGILGSLVSNPLGAVELATQMYGFSKAMGAKGMTGIPVIAASFTDNADKAHAIFVQEHGREPTAVETGVLMTLAAAGTAMDTAASKVLYGGGKTGEAFSKSVSTNIEKMIMQVPGPKTQMALRAIAKTGTVMGIEGVQEAFTEGTTVLGGTQDVDKATSGEYAKDIYEAGALGAISGPGMKVINTAEGVFDYTKEKVQDRKAKAKGYTREQRVDETKRAREIFTGVREGLTTGSMTASQALKQLNELDMNAMASTESTQATKLRDMSMAKLADDSTPKTYGSEQEAILDIENIAVGAKSLAPESADYKAIQSIAKNANITPELLAKTLKTYESVESEATVEARGYLTAGLQLRTEQAKGESANIEKIAKLSDRLDKFYQSTETTYNRLKSGYENLMGATQLRSVKVGDYTIHKSKEGIAAYKKIMEAKERTMKGILDQAKKANVKLISKPTVQQPYYKTADGKKVAVPVEDIKSVSAIIAPETSGIATANPTMTTDENTNFVENQLVGIAVPRHNVKDAVVNATNISDFTKEDGKGAMAKIRKSIDAAIKAGTKFKIHEPKGHSKALVRLVIEHLKANGYQYAGKEWVKSEVLNKNKKPKVAKEVIEDTVEKEVAELQVVSNKDLLARSSSKGKEKVSNQSVDISTIVISRVENSLDTNAITNKDTKTHSIVKTWQAALLKLIPSILTEELIKKSSTRELTKWESIANLKAKDDPARGILFLDDGTVNSKAIAAMALAGNEYIMAKAGTMNYMDTDTAKNILGSNKASFHNINKIKQLGIPAVVAIDSLGNSVLNYMGLAIGKDVPIEVEAKLKAALGQHTLMLMEAKGLVNIQTPTTGAVGAMKGKKTYKLGIPGAEATVSFVQVPKKTFSTITTQTREIFTKMKEELAITGTLVTGPTSAKPQPKEYKKTRARRNKITIVPEKAIDALNKLASEKYTAVKSAVEWVRNNTEQAKILMGYQYDIEGELAKLSRRDRESIEATNMAIAKEVEVMLDPTLDDGMYFDWFFSRNGRFMLDSNTINPQTGKKLHRWVYVSKGNTYQVTKGQESDEFYMAVAQAVGYGIDKKQIAKSVAVGKEVIELGSKVLKTALDEKHLKTANGTEIEVEHLGAYLTMLDVVEKLEGAKTGEAIESQLTMEFDAKTSGFGLKIGQLGFDGGYQEKVGVYVGDRSDVTNISDQLDPGDTTIDPILDVYQGSAKEMNVEAMKVTPKLQGVWKELSKHIPKAVDGKITSELRNLFKQPFMEFNYAAGLKTLIESFSTKIVEDILNDIAKENGKGYKDLLAQIKAVTQSKGMPGLTNIPATLREKYSEDIKYGKSNLQQLLIGLVTETYGQQLEDHYKKKYQELIDANQVMNNAFVGMFAAYRQAYNAKVADIKGITAEQKVDIIRELQNVFPLIRGPLSTDINEGIPIYDSTRTHAEGEFGPAQVSYLKEDGKLAQKTAQAIIKEFEAATKAGAVVPIHYIDGVAMATSINKSKTGLLGVHDAEVVSPNNAKEATHNYNESWYEIQSSYSVIEAVAEALTRVVNETTDANKIKVKVPLLEGMSGMENGEYNVNLVDLAHMTNIYAMQVSAKRAEFFNQPMTVAHMAGPVGSAYNAEAKSLDVYNPTINPEHKYSMEKVSKSKVESEPEDNSTDIAEEYEVATEAEISYNTLSETTKKIVEGCL